MTDPGGPPPQGFRTFLVLWSTQSLSVIGSALAAFAFNIYLTQTVFPLPQQKPQLALALSLTALAFTLTALLGAPIAGAWADRHDRRRIMLTCDVISGALSLALAALILFAHPPIAVLVALTALTGLTSTFHASAFDTSYATLVTRAQLPRANGMMQTIWSVSTLASPALAAVIIGVPALARQSGGWPWLAALPSGVPLAMLLDGLTFFVAAGVLTRLRLPSPRVGAPGGRTSLLADVGVGWRYILDRRPLLWLLLTFALANFVGSPIAVFEPLLVKFNLQPDWSARGLSFEAALAVIATANSVGGVVGGVLISAWGGLRRRRVLGVVAPMLVGGLAQALFGWSAQLALSAAALFAMGLTLPFMNAHSQAIWQAQVPPELQGRVFSVRRFIAQFTSPLSIALAGFLAGALPPGAVIGVLGLLLAAFCAAQLFNPLLRRVEDRAWLERGASARFAARSGPPPPADAP